MQPTAEKSPSSHSPSAPSELGRVVLYLALPNAVFLIGWCQWWAALGGSMALAWLLRPLVGRPAPEDSSPTFRVQLILLVVALAWAVFGGAGHLFHANKDWIVRDAVLRDLVVFSWPVAYRLESGENYLLRAPIGYYLPAALLGKVIGLRLADYALLAWTTLGVWLLLGLVVRRKDPPRWIAAKVLLVIVFSGMDVVGNMLVANPFDLTTHLEWWARSFQYSSNTTQLFWVPGHALPGWLAVAALYRHPTADEPPRALPALLALIPLWSPLAAIGFAPFALLALIRHVRSRGIPCEIDVRPGLAAGVVIIVVGSYLTARSDAISSGWVSGRSEDPLGFAVVYAIFLLVEIALIVFLVLRESRSPEVILATVLLILIPFYSFGPGNDFAMRSSIPALMVLTIALADLLPRLLSRGQPELVRLLAGAVLALGAVTPMTEFARAILMPSWPPDQGRSLPESTRGAHYLLPIDGELRTPFLSQPSR